MYSSSACSSMQPTGVNHQACCDVAIVGAHYMTQLLCMPLAPLPCSELHVRRESVCEALLCVLAYTARYHHTCTHSLGAASLTVDCTDQLESGVSHDCVCPSSDATSSGKF
jgi:hypothetical protein